MPRFRRAQALCVCAYHTMTKARFTDDTTFTDGTVFTDLLPEFERLAPDAILATSNLQDTLSNSPPTRLEDIDEDVTTDDDQWWTAVDSTLATEARLGFPTPSNTLTGTQNFKALLRKTPGTADPTVDIELYEAGVFVATLSSAVAITSTSGQVVEATWSAGDVANAADVEVRVVATVG